MPLLDEISPEAAAIGSVNTIVSRAGRLTGYNTDAFGFTWLLQKSGVDVAGKRRSSSAPAAHRSRSATC